MTNRKNIHKKIIALVGMPGAGKSEAADFFKEKKLPVLRFGDITEIEINRRGLELTQENERKIREGLRNKFGMAAYAIKMKPRIEKSKEKNESVVLDGLYSWEEYVYLKNHYEELFLLCIYASPQIRYNRLLKRHYRGLNKAEARQRDIAELEKLNKGGPIAIADYLIKNEGTLDSLYKNLDVFIASFNSS